MNEPTKPRFTVDLEEIDRQLRRSSPFPSPRRDPNFAEALPVDAPMEAAPVLEANNTPDIEVLNVPPAIETRDPFWGSTPGSDPLQELARIVGQEDPFQSLLGRSSAPQTVQPTSYYGDVPNPPIGTQPPSSFGEAQGVDPVAGYDLPENSPQVEPIPYSGQPELAEPQANFSLSSGDLAALAQIAQVNSIPPLRGVEQQDEGGASYHQPMPVNTLDPRMDAQDEYSTPSYADPRIGYNQEYDFVEPDDIRPAKSSTRKKLLLAGSAIIVVALLSVIGYGFLRSKGVLTAGEPPLITASEEPTKVAPETPDGKEFPDQNKQIYQGSTKEGSTQVVNREEQPVDVRETIGARNSFSSNDNGFGETRKVRTVSVRPDGTIIGEPAPSVTAQSMERTARAPSTNSSIQIARATPSVQPTPSTQTTTTTSSRPQQAQVVSGNPQTPPTASSAARATQPPSAVSSAGGAYAVQFGVSASEAEGRTRFNRLKTQFPNVLANVNPSIFAAEVNGRTLYRIRTGGMPKDAGDALCSKLKDAGGECFVTRN